MNVEELLGKCEMLSVDKDYDGILKLSQKALKLDPENVGALSYNAMALYYLGEYRRTLEILNRILEIEGENGYFEYFKVRVLIKLNVNEAYDFYDAIGSYSPDKSVTQSLAHALIDAEEYDKALECLDMLNETNWLFSCRIIDGYKRIENRTGRDLKDRYASEFHMSWIEMIKSRSDREICPLCGGDDFNNQFSFCNNCCEEIQMSSRGTLIECDDLKVYYYICDKLAVLKRFLKEHAFLKSLHEEMDCLDDEEFSAFIEHLKSIGYIVEASKGYIWDGEIMSSTCEAGKYAAPRWLAFPGFSAWTIGWRMGAGEDYCMNQPYQGELFAKLFPEPKNWKFNPRNPKFKNLPKFPFMGAIWDEDVNPKYSKITDDAIEVNDFITLDAEGEFRNDAHHFNSIGHAILFSKIVSYNRNIDPYKVTFEELKNDFTITDEQLAEWEVFKYTVCLNATYYKFMQDAELKQKLLATGDKCLVYSSDDEWGGDENLFGFALMQVRDEIRRLCEHEDLIDWRYTEYLKCAYPYLNHRRDPNDKQSAEYKVIESTLVGSSRYVRDANLTEEIAAKYKAGQIITEKAFVDASNRIGGMVTTHRYLILSGFMGDLSVFEKDTNWGIHTANHGSRFKVLDVFTVDGKTQILLLHLPDGFEEVFSNETDIEREFVERERENFINDLKQDIIKELADEIWLERCSFPLGMDEKGNFY